MVFSMKCIISWMVRNRSFEAGWGRPNCSSESVHRSLVPSHQVVYEPLRPAVRAQQACRKLQVRLLRQPIAPLLARAWLRTAGAWGLRLRSPASLLILLLTGRWPVVMSSDSGLARYVSQLITDSLCNLRQASLFRLCI